MTSDRASVPVEQVVGMNGSMKCLTCGTTWDALVPHCPICAAASPHGVSEKQPPYTTWLLERNSSPWGCEWFCAGKERWTKEAHKAIQFPDSDSAAEAHARFRGQIKGTFIYPLVESGAGDWVYTYTITEHIFNCGIAALAQGNAGGQCIGYPVCDGDLVGEPHDAACPAPATEGLEKRLRDEDEITDLSTIGESGSLTHAEIDAVWNAVLDGLDTPIDIDKVCAQARRAIEAADAEAALRRENESLKVSLDIFTAPSPKMPCGHPDYLGYTKDDGKNILCFACQLAVAERQLADARGKALRYEWLRANHLQTGPDSWIRTGDDLDDATDEALVGRG